VKFRGLCEGRDFPVLRIGVTDAEVGTQPVLEVQDQFTVGLEELQHTHRSTLPEHFGPVVA
jgi:phosphoribosylformylglycinamidine synthase